MREAEGGGRFVDWKLLPAAFSAGCALDNQTAVGGIAVGMLELPPDDFRKEYALRMQEALVNVGFWKCCISCEHFSNNSAERREKEGPSRTCHRWNAEPPPKTIVYGCTEWSCLVPF